MSPTLFNLRHQCEEGEETAKDAEKQREGAKKGDSRKRFMFAGGSLFFGHAGVRKK